jgi:hypothetical protein
VENNRYYYECDYTSNYYQSRYIDCYICQKLHPIPSGLVSLLPGAAVGLLSLGSVSGVLAGEELVAAFGAAAIVAGGDDLAASATGPRIEADRAGVNVTMPDPVAEGDETIIEASATGPPIL